MVDYSNDGIFIFGKGSDGLKHATIMREAATKVLKTAKLFCVVFKRAAPVGEFEAVYAGGSFKDVDFRFFKNGVDAAAVAQFRKWVASMMPASFDGGGMQDAAIRGLILRGEDGKPRLEIVAVTVLPIGMYEPVWWAKSSSGTQVATGTGRALFVSRAVTEFTFDITPGDSYLVFPSIRVREEAARDTYYSKSGTVDKMRRMLLGLEIVVA